jgi:hypothetical protein
MLYKDRDDIPSTGHPEQVSSVVWKSYVNKKEQNKNKLRIY